MASTYCKCDAEVDDVIVRMIGRHHPDLEECSVRILQLFAENADGPAVKHGGYPALATIRLNNLKERVAGLLDVTLLIDHSRWAQMDEAGKEALIDHELEHLVLRRDKEGNMKLDDIGRPKFSLKKHDFEIGGFYSVVKRHQRAAHEAIAIAAVNRTFMQGVLAFTE